MDRRHRPGALGCGVTVLTLTALGLVGCGSGPGPEPAGTTTSSGPVVQSTTLPAGWPAGLTLPDGATVAYSTTDDTGMSVLFDAPQDLATVRAYYQGVVTGLGFRAKTDDSFVDMLSASWSDGTVTISVTATPVADRTSGVLLVQPET